MKVTFIGEESTEQTLNGGSPQGTLLVNSIDNADSVDPEDRYIDDLSVFLVMMFGLLTYYDVLYHVPSDIAVYKPYLPLETFGTQNTLDRITEWTG